MNLYKGGNGEIDNEKWKTGFSFLRELGKYVYGEFERIMILACMLNQYTYHNSSKLVVVNKEVPIAYIHCSSNNVSSIDTVLRKSLDSAYTQDRSKYIYIRSIKGRAIHFLSRCVCTQ